MPWWNSPFSGKSSHSDDCLIGRGRQGHHLKSYFSRRSNRDHAPSKTIQPFGENGINQLCNPSNGLDQPACLRRNLALPEPQPLPLPELQYNYTNTSPKDHKVPNAGFGNGRDSYEEYGRSLKNCSSARSPGRDYSGFNIYTSAPTSPLSSPLNLSPLRSRDGGGGGGGGGNDILTSQYGTPPGCFQVWSAPEMIPSSCTDSSPSGPSSIDNTSFIRRESSSPSLPNNVHPLPLPPTSPPSPLPHFSHIPEIVPISTQWQKGKLLGRGTFGTVYVASNRETGALCAMKEVDVLPDDSKSAECIKQLEQEIKVLSNLKHPNIVQYYGSEILEDKFNIYLEYVHPGCLTKFITDHCGAISESVVRNFTRHILCGLAYLHSTRTIHRDIKGANLLVDAYGVVKLADFGMAKHIHGHNANLSLKGSPYWMAPELLHSVLYKDDSPSNVALAVDIWSLGCTVIEMLTGSPPWSKYEGAAAMFKVLQENPPYPDGLSEEGQDFLNCCFRRNPGERPTAAMLLEHRFVKGNHHASDAPLNSRPKPSVVKDSLLSRRGHHVPMFSDGQIMQRKFVEQHHEMRYRSNSDGLKMRMALLHSPCSTLDGFPGVSPPNSGYMYLRSPIEKFDRTTKKV